MVSASQSKHWHVAFALLAALKKGVEPLKLFNNNSPKNYFSFFLFKNGLCPDEGHNGFVDVIEYQMWIEEIKHERG